MSMTGYHLKSSYGENSDSLRDAVVAGVKEELEAKLREEREAKSCSL